MDYLEFMKIYDQEHACCPVCDSNNFSSTMLGFFYDENHPEEYKDSNSVHCYTCGWHGIYHDLVPMPEKTRFQISALGGLTKEKARKIADMLNEKYSDAGYFCIYETEARKI